jgi:hypothetical protein
MTCDGYGKPKKLAAWHVMPHHKHPDKQGCNCQFRNKKIFNPRKQRMVTTHPSVFVYVQCISFNRICCQFICCCLWIVICLLANCFYSHSFVSVPFWTLCFVRIFSVRLCVYSVCHFSVLILELFSRYLDPQTYSTINHPEGHQTAPSFVLV